MLPAKTAIHLLEFLIATAFKLVIWLDKVLPGLDTFGRCRRLCRLERYPLLTGVPICLGQRTGECTFILASLPLLWAHGWHICLVIRCLITASSVRRGIHTSSNLLKFLLPRSRPHIPTLHYLHRLRILNVHDLRVLRHVHIILFWKILLPIILCVEHIDYLLICEMCGIHCSVH